jgi:hypothetical protein
LWKVERKQNNQVYESENGPSREVEREEEGKGVNIIKVHYMHVWNITMKPPTLARHGGTHLQFQLLERQTGWLRVKANLGKVSKTLSLKHAIHGGTYL